jgi:hypothetical protein
VLAPAGTSVSPKKRQMFEIVAFLRRAGISLERSNEVRAAWTSSDAKPASTGLAARRKRPNRDSTE